MGLRFGLGAAHRIRAALLDKRGRVMRAAIGWLRLGGLLLVSVLAILALAGLLRLSQ
jgi:hypothetical protein